MATGAYPSLFYPGQVYPSQPVSGVSQLLPYDLRVECAFGSNPDDVAPAYTDITPYVDLTRGFTRNSYGRSDEYSTSNPSQAQVGLDNTDGRFTPGNASGAYYPNVTGQKRLRVSYRDSSVGGNLLAAEDASFEGGTVGAWVTTYLGSPAAVTLANSATHPSDGTKGMLITWPTAAAQCSPQLYVNIVNGRTYTARCVVWIPAGSPAVRFGDLFGNGGAGGTVDSTTTGAFQTLTVTFTATSSNLYLGIRSLAATTAGQQCFVDAIMVDEGTSLGSFTTAAPPISYRFTGHVNSWACEWPTGNGNTSAATVQASDRLARLGAMRTLDSIIAEEILYDGPLYYAPMGEPDGSTSVGSIAKTQGTPLAVTQVGTGGTLTFATATGSGFDGQSAPTFTPVDANNGLCLTGQLPQVNSGYAYELRACFNTSTLATSSIVRMSDVYGAYLQLGIDSTGHLTAKAWDPWSGTFVASVTSSTVYASGTTRDAAVTMILSGSTVTMTLYGDGASLGTSSFTANGFPAYAVQMTVGGVAGAMFTGTISHVAVYAATIPTAARIGQHASGILTGYAGERTDQRIARYARLAGIDPTEQVLDVGSTTSTGFQDSTGKTALALMQDIAATEGGRLFVDGAGRLTFYSRARKWASQAPDVTVDAEVLASSASFALDLQGIVNDATASIPNGGKLRAVDTTSQTTYGVMSASDVTVYSTTQQGALDVINYRVATNSTPKVRLPATTPLDLLTMGSTTAGQLLGLELGKRLRVTGLPSQAPASQVDLIVEGWSESWNLGDVSIAPNTSNGVLDVPWILEDATYGAIDGDNRIIY